ncbi:MAG: flagellar M-ring protein FliF C-terminal domain-containing protein [bacterium]
MTVRPGATRPTRPTTATRITQTANTQSPNNILETINKLDTKQKILVITVLIVLIIIGLGIFFYTKSNEYVPLVPGGKLDSNQLSKVKQYLEQRGIREYKIDDAIGQVYIHPRYHNTVYVDVITEGFVKPDIKPKLESIPPGTTKEAWMSYQKTLLEYALANMIKRNYQGKVNEVNVFITYPENNPFSTDQQPTKATVSINTFAGQSLNNQEAKGVIIAIAGAVKGLEPSNISLVVNGMPVKPYEEEPAESAFMIKSKIEEQYANKVRNALDQILGANNYTFTIDVQLRWDRIEKYAETYGNMADPNSKMVSRQTTEKSKEYEGGALDKNKESATERQRQIIENRKVDMVVTKIQQNPGESIERISVAVNVSNASPSTLSQIQTYVKNAVGLREERGDSIAVTNIPHAYIASAVNSNIPSPQVIPTAPVKQTFPIQTLIISLVSALGIATVGILAVFLFKQNKANLERNSIAFDSSLNNTIYADTNVVDLTTDKMGNKTQIPQESKEIKTVVSEIENIARSNPNEVANLLKQTWLTDKKE